ncbi:MAG: DUF6491 family protein [Pseudomonadota bacterium]
MTCREKVSRPVISISFLMYKKQLFIVFFCSSLLACAGSGSPNSAAGSRASGGSDCITEGTIRSYKVLDGSNLVVTAMARRQYHVELARRTSALKFANRIGFNSSGSRICGGFGYVVVNDSLGPDRIRIASIRRLSDEDYEDLLYRFEQAGKQQPPEPEPVEGAEVEELD